jgi:hypothetical protein
VKISELCKMIEDSFHSGRYPVEEQQKNFTDIVEVINRSNNEDLKSSDIKIEVRIQNLYAVNNYVPNIQHLPGVIEMDVLDSFKMLCRRSARVGSDKPGDDIGLSKETLHYSKAQKNS